MLKLKINKKSIETVEKDFFVRGSVGTNFIVTEFNSWWLSDDMFREIAPNDFNKSNIVNCVLNFVFKKTGAPAISGYIIDSVSPTLPSGETTVPIPFEMFSESGKFEIGFYATIYYRTDDMNSDDTSRLLTVPTLWSEEISVEHGTETESIAPSPYTPSEIEKIKNLIYRSNAETLAKSEENLSEHNTSDSAHEDIRKDIIEKIKSALEDVGFKDGVLSIDTIISKYLNSPSDENLILGSHERILLDSQDIFIGSERTTGNFTLTGRKIELRSSDDFVSPIQFSNIAAPTDNYDAVNKEYVDNLIGDIDTALENIITLQQGYIRGENI